MLAVVLAMMLSCMGMTFVLIHGSILDKPRKWLTNKSRFAKQLFQCSLCIGFWVGVIHAMLLWYCTGGVLLPLCVPFASSGVSMLFERSMMFMFDLKDIVEHYFKDILPYKK